MKDNFLHACWFCKLHGRSHRVQLFTSCMQHAWVELNISSAIPLSLPFVKSGTGASLGPSISVDPASPRLHVILLV